MKIKKKIIYVPVPIKYKHICRPDNPTIVFEKLSNRPCIADFDTNWTNEAYFSYALERKLLYVLTEKELIDLLSRYENEPAHESRLIDKKVESFIKSIT